MIIMLNIHKMTPIFFCFYLNLKELNLAILFFGTMIQRIQSIYLLLTTGVSLLFLKGSFLNLIDKEGSVIMITFRGIIKNTNGRSVELIQNIWPFTIILILITLLAMVIIFLYKNRTFQLLLAKILIGLVSGLIFISCYYTYVIISTYDATLIPGVKLGLPVAMLALSVLAFRGIKKDDQLVKSYDRLR